MKQIFTLTFLVLGSLSLMAQQDCAHPQAVTPGTNNVSFSPGSQVPAPTCTNGVNNVVTMGAWFTYTPTELHTTTVSTVASHKDTRVHIYTGTCGALTCVGGDDDGGGAPYYTSIANFTAQPNTTYYIVFDNNWNSDNFSFTLTETEYVAPMFEAVPVSLSGWYKLCVADMNGDYLDDIVAPQDNGTVQILYQQENNSGFNSQTLNAPFTQFMPSWSMAAGDFDGNGYNDMLYGDGSGATIILANDTGTAFDEKIETPMDVFSQRTNFVDINADGNLDAFVCHDVAPTIFCINDGSGGGTFYQSGVGGAADLGIFPSGGNYGSIWIDYDNDGDIDMFIAKCRGAGNAASIDELHRNNGDGTFTNVASEMGFADYHQAWSSAWADFDNDGDLDVLVGASSDAAGGHKLMMNNGTGPFTNVTAGSGYDTFGPMSIEHVAHDFDNDGFVDILGGGNQIMFNNGDMTFSPVSIPASSGPIGDLNNDGFLDIQNGNTVFMNGGNDNNWLTVTLKGTDSNMNGIGARIELHAEGSAWGDQQIREIRSGDGFKYMSSLNAHFGLGETEAIDHVVIRWPSGTVDIIENPDINGVLHIVEGETLGTNQVNGPLVSLYPNPAKDVLNIGGNIEVAKANIYDLSGKLISSVAVVNTTVPVQQLNKGTYIIILHDANGKPHSSKFIKG